MGFAYLMGRQYDKAIADYNKFIELNPKLAEAYRKRGMAYEDNRQYDKAISDFTKIIKLKPKDVEAYDLRAYAYESKGQDDKAIADFDKAIEIIYSRAISYQKKGQYKKACSHYIGACLRGSEAACRQVNMLEEKGLCQPPPQFITRGDDYFK